MWLGIEAIMKKRKTEQRLNQMEQDFEIVNSKPDAMALHIVRNESGWKWICFTYDPDGKRLQAGAVEGILIPHGLKGGLSFRSEAIIDGIDAIRQGQWHGNIVLVESKGDDYES